ncbi:MAG: tetratricopeptide repeat protein [Thermoanaerobaculia bacterium]|nr:tetratricopeptide repeat protein [Thermoanaerobaculia bacterium]
MKSLLTTCLLTLLASATHAQAASPTGPESPVYEQARKAVEAGDLEEGIRLLEEEVARDPDSRALRDLAALEASTGRFREAFFHLRRWLEHNPGDEEARRAAATAALRLRRPDAAEDVLDGASLEEPANRMLQGRIHLLRQEHDAVVETLAPLLDDPEGRFYPDALQATAMAELEAGRPSRVVEVLEGEAQRSPGLRLLLGQGLYQSGEAEKAADLLSPLFDTVATGGSSLPPDFAADVAAEYGRVLLALDRREEAVEAVRLATELEPGDAHAWESLSQTLARAGRMEEAKRALAEYRRLEEEQGTAAEKAMAHDRALEDPVLPSLRRAAELALQGDLQSALDVLRDEMVLSPEDPRPPTLASRLLLARGSTREAFQMAQRAVSLSRGEMRPRALAARGLARMASGSPLEAESDFESALEEDPELVTARLGLARVQMVKGDPSGARRQLERVLELDPDHEEARALLRQLEQHQKAGDEGR